jgi:hypothetical protein
MSAMATKRTMEALGETHRGAEGVPVTATPERRHALLDHHHHAGVVRSVDLETEMSATTRQPRNTLPAEVEPSTRATLRLWAITLVLVLFNLSALRLG